MAETMNQIAAQVAHSVDLQRLANSIARGENDQYDALAKFIRELLLEYDVINSKKLRDELIKQITAEVADTADNVTASMLSQIDDVIRQEVNFQWVVLRNISSKKPIKPKLDAVSRAILNQPLVLNGKGMTWEERIGSFKANQVRDAKQIIMTGWANGLTTTDIANQLIGTRSANGVISLTRTGANALAKDLITHCSSVTKAELAQQNDDIIIGEKTIVTLDSRTSPICQDYGSQDRGGKEWIYAKVGRSFPRPPFHWRAVLRGETVTTSKGLVAIEDVAVGDYVLTHAGRYKKVTAVMGKKESVKIKLLIDNFGRSMRLTGEHPVLTQRDGWKRADQILVGDIFFNNTEKLPSCVSNVVAVSSVDKSSLIDSYNIVTEVTEDLVSCGVFSKSRGVTSAIEFNNGVLYEEVSNANANRKLRFEFNSNLNKQIEEFGFVTCKVFTVCSSLRFCCLEFDIKVIHGVFCKHSLSVFFGELLRRLNVLGSPVVIPRDWWVEFEAALNGLRSTHCLNPEFLGSLSYNVIGEALLSLYHSERLTEGKVLNLDESSDFFVGCDFHANSSWFVSTCISVVDYTTDDYVFNLSVEDDETYLVNGFLVHNCRSSNTFIVAKEYDLEVETTRPAVVDGKAIQVDSKTDWLSLAKRYPSIAEQALGKTRAKLIDEMSAKEFQKVAYDSLNGFTTIDEMVANSKKVASLLAE